MKWKRKSELTDQFSNLCVPRATSASLRCHPSVLPVNGISSRVHARPHALTHKHTDVCMHVCVCVATVSGQCDTVSNKDSQVKRGAPGMMLGVVECRLSTAHSSDSTFSLSLALSFFLSLSLLSACCFSPALNVPLPLSIAHIHTQTLTCSQEMILFVLPLKVYSAWNQSPESVLYPTLRAQGSGLSCWQSVR